MAVNWGPVGQQLATMGRRAEDAYEDRLGTLVTRGRAEQQLGQEIMATQSVLKSEPNLVALGYSPEQARVISGALAGGYGSDLKAAEETLGAMAARGYQQDARDAAVSMYGADNPNAHLFGIAKGPQQLAKIEGDTLLGNVFAPGGDSQGPTAIGNARIGTMAAQARASDASARAALGRLAIAQNQFELQRQGRWNPDGQTPGGAGGGRALSAPVVLQLTKDAEKLQNLNSLEAGFKEDYAGNPSFGGLENTLGRMGWTGGVTGATPGQAEWWQQYDRYKNEVRNELFGASLTEGEQKAFEQADVNPGMSPAVIQKNLAKQSEILKKGLERKGRVWAAQGYNQNAIQEATGLPLGGGLGQQVMSSPAAPRRRKYNPETGRAE